ncbi:hypothetical protein LAZ67_2000889 [Cordylochernes scorpioides]|uniref:CCHC-type domain-containing protein n=1 Tax=Cordylochernes scorpioides TaxID=51811 RepID=A0ABY6K4A5_9ARAC|nr:hypothetical protein LAZ67_2000889 [Cordylochernes scorpioides]
MSKSRIKTMIIVFLDIRGIVHCEFVPQGQTVNSAFYLEVLRRLKRRIARVRTDIKDTVKLHHDNATSHTAFIITNFLARSNTPCGNPITHPLPRLPSTFHIGFTTEPVKVDRMTDDSNMQRMTEAGDEYFADALTNIQPHCEDLVSRLTDAIRGLAVPRVEEALISPFDGSYAASNFIQQLERTSERPQDDATLQTRLRTLLKVASGSLVACEVGVDEMEGRMDSYGQLGLFSNYHQEAAADSVVDSEVEITEAATTAGKKATASLNVPNLPVVVDVAVDRAVMEAATTPATTAEKLATVNMSFTNNTAEDGGQEENQRKSKKACYTCGEFGHKKDDCPKSGTQESGNEEESSDNEEEETPQKRKQAEDSEKEEVEAEEPPKKKSKKPKSKKKIAI